MRGSSSTRRPRRSQSRRPSLGGEVGNQDAHRNRERVIVSHELTPPYMSDPMGWHYDFIPPLIRALRPEVYVELGVREAHLFNLVSPFAGHAIGVDIDPMSGECIQGAPNVTFHCCTTMEFLDEAKRTGLAIDVLFIDADHSYEAALEDFRSYLPYVRPHGLILMHDAHPGDASLAIPTQCGGVYQAVEELSAENDEYEMVTIPLSPGVTICRKRTRQLAWQEPEAGVRTPLWGPAREPRPIAASPAEMPAADESGGGSGQWVRLRNSSRAALRPVVASVLGEERLKRVLTRVRGAK